MVNDQRLSWAEALEARKQLRKQLRKEIAPRGLGLIMGLCIPLAFSAYCLWVSANALPRSWQPMPWDTLLGTAVGAGGIWFCGRALGTCIDDIIDEELARVFDFGLRQKLSSETASTSAPAGPR